MDRLALDASVTLTWCFQDEATQRRSSGRAKRAAEKRLQAVILIRQPTEKNLGSCRIKQLRGSFVVPLRAGLLRMTVPSGFSAPCKAPPFRSLK
jgi:hypothetical protein